MKGNERSEPREIEHASTPEEVKLAEELFALQDTAATVEDVGDFADEEFKWLVFLKNSGVRSFIDDGRITIRAVRGKNGEFEKVEIHNNAGRLLFYSNNKDFDELVRKINGWDKIN
jgi:hypothetical protein